MSTRATLRTEIQNRLNDSGAAIWTANELNGYITQAVNSLYPAYWKYQTATTVAGAGPLQTNPSGGRNFYYIGLQKPLSTRVRLLRQCKEGSTSTFIPKTGISGETLVWAWTTGYTAPTDDNTALDFPAECEEVVVLRVQITALERILTSRVDSAKYFALTVREGVTETDLTATLDALHASLTQRLQTAVKRPDRQG